MYSSFDTIKNSRDRRRTRSPEGPQMQLRELRPRHHEIIRLGLLGFKNRQIARMLNITPQSVTICLSSQVAREYMSLLQAARSCNAVDLAKEISDFAPTCVEVIKEGIQDETVPMPVRMREAREFLGLGGYVKPQRLSVQGTITHLTPQEIEEIKKRALQTAQLAGVLPSPADQEDKDILHSTESPSEEDPLDVEFLEVSSSCVGTEKEKQGQSAESAGGK